MEIAQLLAAATFRPGPVSARLGSPAIISDITLLHLSHFPGDQQGAGVGEGGAGAVVERDPALHVELARFLVEQGDIIRFPAHARRQIAQRHRPCTALRRIHGDAQRRARAQIGRNGGKNDPHRQTVVAQHLDPFADLQHHAAIGRQHQRLFPRFRACGGVGAEQGDRLADRFFHQRCGRQKVIVEILFDYADAFARQCHCFGAYARGDIGKFLTRASEERDTADVLHQRQIIIVDGDGQIALGVRGR